MQLSPGSRLGPYEVVAAIGAGGMGEVWKARDTRLERSVAIKVLPAEFAHNAQLRLRFEREAKTISQLNHPHICTLYDVGDDYLVMELIEGESLADRLEKGALPLADVLRFGAQIAEALDRAHRAGVVHRDLKPGNVMITKAGAKLLDFGLAKSGAADVSDGLTVQKPLTQEGTILGTYQYMAPEQLAGEESDARTDIFALGTVLYEMMTGHRAFEGKTRTSLVSQIMAGQPRPLTELQPLTPPALEHVIRKCLVKERDERWQSASDVASELRWIAEERPETRPARASRTPRTLRAVSALLLIATAAFATLWWQARARARRMVTTSVVVPPGHAFNFEIGAMVLSPNGRLLAAIATDADGASDLFLHDLESGEARKLEGTSSPSYPFWSPDSRFLAFFADGKLKAIDIESGPPQTLSDAPDGRGGSWNEKGTIVFAPQFREGLHVVPASGGKSRELTRTAKGEISHRWPHFLPDGDHVVFLSQRAEGGAVDDPSTIEVLSLSTGKRQTLLRANSSALYARPGYLLFWRDGSLLAQEFDAGSLELKGTPVALVKDASYTGTEQAVASVSAEGTLAFHAGGKLGQSRLVDSTRGGVNHVAIDAFGDYYNPALSPDGKQVAVSVVDQTEDIRIFDLERGTATRFTFHSGDEESPVWSPDGQWIAFKTIRSDTGDVYVKRTTGETPEEPLVVTPHGMRPTSWSPDGRSLLIDATGGDDGRSPMNDIWIYSFDQKKAVPLIHTPFDESSGQFSPDGKAIAYASTETGRREIYVQFLGGGGKTQVSTGGGRAPRWNGDGREIFYTGAGEMVMGVKVTPAPSGFTAGKPESLFTFRHKNGGDGGPAFDVSRDGKHFLLNMLTANTDAPVTVVQNWTGRLKHGAR